MANNTSGELYSSIDQENDLCAVFDTPDHKVIIKSVPKDMLLCDEPDNLLNNSKVSCVIKNLCSMASKSAKILPSL